MRGINQQGWQDYWDLGEEGDKCSVIVALRCPFPELRVGQCKALARPHETAVQASAWPLLHRTRVGSFLSFSFFYIYIFIIFYLLYHIRHREVRGQLAGVAPLPTMWVLGIPRRSSGLTASTLSAEPSLRALFLVYVCLWQFSHGSPDWP